MNFKLKVPGVQGLALVQAEFNRYQNEAFPARKPEFFALELCGEAGELANLEKKLWRDPARALDAAALSDEAADVFIALMNYANARELSLERAIARKLERIEERRLAGNMGPAL